MNSSFLELQIFSIISSLITVGHPLVRKIVTKKKGKVEKYGKYIPWPPSLFPFFGNYVFLLKDVRSMSILQVQLIIQIWHIQVKVNQMSLIEYYHFIWQLNIDMFQIKQEKTIQ